MFLVLKIHDLWNFILPSADPGSKKLWENKIGQVWEKKYEVAKIAK